MASYDSHLQGCSPGSLHVLGMNADELQANRSATTRLVQDLNHQPALPFEDASLDAVVCTASVEYLVQPHKILAEALRVLRPGGIFVTAFSNRWFPTKAIRLWGELHEFERMGLVLEYFRQAGNFTALQSESLRGLPRPENDKYAGQLACSDPVFAVWGRADT